VALLAADPKAAASEEEHMQFIKARRARLRGRSLLAIVILGLVLSACGESAGGSDKASAGHKYTIGLIKFSGADQTSTLLIKGYAERAAELGYEATSIDPQGEADKAVAAMQTLVQKGVDMIVVTVFPSSQLTAGLLAAKSAGIPVISLGGGPAPGVQAAWTSDRVSGEETAKKMMEDTGGTGSLLVLSYTASTPCVDRESGLYDTIEGSELEANKKREEIPVPGQVAAGTQFAQAFLAQHPSNGQNLAIWACWDDPALGAVTAVKQDHRSDVKIYAINGQSDAIKAVQDGDMAATYWIDVEGGGKLVADQTKKYIDAGVDAKPQVVSVPGVLVTADNVEKFVKDHPSVLAAQ
jgi:ribose transport system substrate-binding protein